MTRMTAINETLRKAEIALGVILEYDEKNSTCTFRELLDEIIERWRSQN
jgi:hypothetical protein